MVHNPRLCFQAKNLPIRAIHGNDALRSSRHARERADDEQRNPLGARGRRQMSESDLKPKDPRPSRLRSLSRLGLDPSEAASRKPKVRPIKTRFPSRACVLLAYTPGHLLARRRGRRLRVIGCGRGGYCRWASSMSGRNRPSARAIRRRHPSDSASGCGRSLLACTLGGRLLGRSFRAYLATKAKRLRQIRPFRRVIRRNDRIIAL